MFRRQEKQILEGDEAIISVIKQLSMHSIRYQFVFEACRNAVSGTWFRATRMRSRHAEPLDLRRALSMQSVTSEYGSVRSRFMTPTK